MKKVSVITCTLGTDGLDQLYESLKGQTVKPDRWVIKDCQQGSLDPSARYMSGGFTVEYENKPDTGLSDGLNQALERVDSGIIMLLHNGDKYGPKFIEEMAKSISEKSVSYTDVTWTVDERPIGRRKAQKNICLPLYDMPRINHPTFCCYKNVYELVGGFNSKYKIAMDFDWTLRALRSGVRFKHVSDAGYYMDAEGLSHSNFVRMRGEVFDIASAQGDDFSKLKFKRHWMGRRVKLLVKHLLGLLRQR